MEGEADSLARRTYPEGLERDVLDELCADLVATASATAEDYLAGLAAEGRPSDERLIDLFVAHLTAFAPGAHADRDITERERHFYRAIAVCDDDPRVARRLRGMLDEVCAAFEPVVAQYLERSARRPKAPLVFADLPRLLGGILEGFVLRQRFDTTLDARLLGAAVLLALQSWTEEDPALAAVEAEPDAMATIEELRELDARLATIDPLSDEGLRIAMQVLTAASASTLAFWLARRRAEVLVRVPGLRDSEQGHGVWVAAAEMLSMAEADRPLAEAVADLALADSRPALEEDPQTMLRTSWLLLRLERFDDALEHIEAFRVSCPDPRRAGMSDALESYARCAIGPLSEAVALGRSAAACDDPLAATLGAGVAVRALVLSSDLDAANAVLRDVPLPSALASMGATMLTLARGLVRLEDDRPLDALEDLLRVTEHLRRIGSRNPSGWPWLEPTVRAMLVLGERRRALATLRGAVADAERWGTPIVLSELRLAQAHIAADPVERDRVLGEALTALRDSPAAVQRARVLRRLHAPGATATDRPGMRRDPAVETLSPRVREVAELAADGLRDAEIAERLGISVRTVNRHVSSALKATGSRSRVELTRRLS